MTKDATCCVPGPLTASKEKGWILCRNRQPHFRFCQKEEAFQTVFLHSSALLQAECSIRSPLCSHLYWLLDHLFDGCRRSSPYPSFPYLDSGLVKNAANFVHSNIVKAIIMQRSIRTTHIVEEPGRSGGHPDSWTQNSLETLVVTNFLPLLLSVYFSSKLQTHFSQKWWILLRTKPHHLNTYQAFHCVRFGNS